MHRLGRILAGLCVMLAGPGPADALPFRAYVPDFVCAVPYFEPGGSCSADLQVGGVELDVLMPHGMRGGVKLKVTTPDGSHFEQDCRWVDRISEKEFGCDLIVKGPSIRLSSAGAGGGQQTMEQWADLELLAVGEVKIIVGEGEGVATLRGRRT